VGAILQGTTYVYSTFVRPFVARHEPEIDRNLNELRTRAADLAVLWWQRSSVYVQARFYELLQYVASQSNRSQQSSIPPLVAALAVPKHSTSQGPSQGPTQVCIHSYKVYLIDLFF
jgi:receptor expression-enhancing protein 1/2/3/4